ncbi:hypothetical protein EDC94DRAFT_662994 [Helicostylum pulchrum]|uniref:Aspartic peptidase DDI1-type domain-containing protein n=1 Tax=Helicostylum pulchrum TaxID=562976 RepID=A0ABP9XSL0_9FUNG|nr:hypothetical protein EDC94DRAFT_662994 [Helicostylum pulchrum]
MKKTTRRSKKKPSQKARSIDNNAKSEEDQVPEEPRKEWTPLQLEQVELTKQLEGYIKEFEKKLNSLSFKPTERETVILFVIHLHPRFKRLVEPMEPSLKNWIEAADLARNHCTRISVILGCERLDIDPMFRSAETKALLCSGYFVSSDSPSKSMYLGAESIGHLLSPNDIPNAPTTSGEDSSLIEEVMHVDTVANTEVIEVDKNEITVSAKEEIKTKEVVVTSESSKEAAPIKEKLPAKEKMPAKETTPTKEKMPAHVKEKMPVKEDSPAKESVTSPVNKEAPTKEALSVKESVPITKESASTTKDSVPIKDPVPTTKETLSSKEAPTAKEIITISPDEEKPQTKVNTDKTDTTEEKKDKGKGVKEEPVNKENIPSPITKSAVQARIQQAVKNKKEKEKKTVPPWITAVKSNGSLNSSKSVCYRVPEEHAGVNLTFLELEVNGKKVKGLLAKLRWGSSAMSLDCVKRLGLDMMETDNFCISTDFGNEDTIGILKLPIVHPADPHIKSEMEIQVLPMIYGGKIDLVLGADFFYFFNPTLNIKSRAIRFLDKETPYIVSKI